MICDPPLLSLLLRIPPSEGAPVRTLVTPSGEMVRGQEVLDREATRVEGWVPHWATCSRRADFKVIPTRKEPA